VSRVEDASREERRNGGERESRGERHPRRRARAPGGELVDLLLAEGARARMVGLLGRDGLPPRTGLLIPRCDSVHTVGMRFAIDVAFVRWPAPTGRVDVLAVTPQLRPWRLARIRRRGRGFGRKEVAALELAAGQAAALGLEAGAALELHDGAAG
jgi:uncharacterized membrane protein (UPF0127 family)